MSTEPPITVTFEPGARSVRVDPETTLLLAAWQSGIAIKSVCGGRGKCGTCLVQFEHPAPAAGTVSEVTRQEAALLPAAPHGRTFRLACMTHVQGDVAVRIPTESEAADTPPRKPYTLLRIASAPMVRRTTVEIEGPYAEPVRPLATRIGEALSGARRRRRIRIDPTVLADYSRQPGFDAARQVTAAVHGGRAAI